MTELGGNLVQPMSGAVANTSRELMNLGIVMPTPAVLERLVNQYRELTDLRARQAGPGQSDDLRRELGVMSLAEYLDAVARFAQIRFDLDEWQRTVAAGKARKAPVSPAVQGFILRGKTRAHTPDLAGWLAYAQEIAPALAPKLDQLVRAGTFPEQSRKMHTLVVAPTGHGKSELLKVLIWHYVRHPGSAVVLLDPGGDLSRQVARWPELVRSDRLVYVEPELRPGRTVGINPFAGGHMLDAGGRNAVAGIIAQMLGDLSADLSENMLTLARFCVTVLLGIKDATLLDLGVMLRRPAGERTVRSFAFPAGSDPHADRRQVIEQAVITHPDPDVRGFFQWSFDRPEYDSARGYLQNRVEGFQAKLDLKHALLGPDTLRLEEAMDTGKIVVVNLKGYGDPRERADVGRLLVGLVAAYGERRGNRPADVRRTPVQLIVDEATELASPRMVDVLEQLRKYGIHLTLAQQVGGRRFDAEQKAVLKQNCRTKIIANEDKREGASLLDYHGDHKQLPDLENGQFWVKWHGDTEIRHLAVRSELRDWSHRVGDAEWQTFVARITGPGGIYRPTGSLAINAPPPAASAATPAAAPAALPPVAVKGQGRRGSPRDAPTRRAKF